MARDLDRLAESLGHRFRQAGLLREATTHPSLAQSRKGRGRTSYERLEFLGDRVLGLVVAELLFHRFPDEAEGLLARRLAALVCRESLVRVALDLQLGAYLALAKGEEEAGGRTNPALLADCCEAVIGALYLDGGLDAARAFIVERWTPMLEEAGRPPKDAKTALQEWAQSRGKPLPAYETVGTEGPAHDPIFEIAVRVEGCGEATGRGSSKRAAEQAAAAAMLEQVADD